MTEGKFPVAVTTLQWWEFLSYKTMLFLRLFRRVILAKPFKASVACKEYSAVFLSLWIYEDKTPGRVKSLTQLSVCPMLNPKGRGVKGGSSSSKFFLTIVSAEVSVKDVLCPQAVAVPEVWMATLTHQLTRLCPGSSGLVKPVNIRKSSAYHTGGGVRDGRAASTRAELREPCSHGSGRGQTPPVKNRKNCFCPTGPQQHQGPCRRAGPAFGGLRGSEESQAGLAGPGCGHDLAMVRQRATLR